MKLVIVESPFSAGGTKAIMDAGASRPGISHSQIERDIVQRNIAYARAAVADCLRLGEAPLASHLLYTQPGILDDGDPDERALGIEAGVSWYGVADACIVYGDYGISPGMESGIARARRFKLPIIGRKLAPQDWAAQSPGGDGLGEGHAKYHEPFGGMGVLLDSGVKTLDEVLALGASSEAQEIARNLILEGTRREIAGDRRGGRALVQAGEEILSLD